MKDIVDKDNKDNDLMVSKKSMSMVFSIDDEEELFAKLNFED